MEREHDRLLEGGALQSRIAAAVQGRDERVRLGNQAKPHRPSHQLLLIGDFSIFDQIHHTQFYSPYIILLSIHNSALHTQFYSPYTILLCTHNVARKEDAQVCPGRYQAVTLYLTRLTQNTFQVKRLIGQRDARLKKNQVLQQEKQQQKKSDIIREIPQVSSSLFFQYNTALRPPYSVLVDTNFLSHTVQHKLDLLDSMMNCLHAECRPIITDCVMGELESLGPRYRIALMIARDERWERLKCDHGKIYADDCLCDRVVRHKTFIVGTNDRDLKRRLRKVPGIPIMSVARGKFVIERLPDAPVK